MSRVGDPCDVLHLAAPDERVLAALALDVIVEHEGLVEQHVAQRVLLCLALVHPEVGEHLEHAYAALRAPVVGGVGYGFLPCHIAERGVRTEVGRVEVLELLLAVGLFAAAEPHLQRAAEFLDDTYEVISL